MNQCYLNIINCHSDGNPTFTTTYINSHNKFYINKEEQSHISYLESGFYSKYEILNFIKNNFYINFDGNSTNQRFIIRIYKNDNSTLIFAMDSALNGNVLYSQSMKELKFNLHNTPIHHIHNTENFKNDLCECINFCLDLLVEIQIFNSNLPINPIKKCKITGADTDIYISTINYHKNTIYVIENDKSEPLMFITNKELLKQYLKYQMRYARYLEKNNILTNEIDSKDYYPRYGHDSEQLLNDCYNYLK